MERNLRDDAWGIIRASLAAVDPQRLMLDFLVREGDILTIGDATVDLNTLNHIYVIGSGKAGAPMAAAVESMLGERITAGLIGVKDGYGLTGLEHIKIMEASHPVPDERGCEVGRRLLGLSGRADENDLVICLISGGGSALMALPAGELSLGDIQTCTDLLLRCGAAIDEINTVRKHLTLVSAGQLARETFPARMLTIVISDVIGDDLATVASGPTVPDGSRYQDALDVLERYGLLEKAPATVISHLKAGAAGSLPETPKPGEPWFERVSNHIIGSNRTALDGAAAAAGRMGYRVDRIRQAVTGQAKEAAAALSAMAVDVKKETSSLRPPVCILAGGETTVTVTGKGTGGRAQEFALAAAMQLAGTTGVTVFAFGTDGTDGPTGAAGAFARGDTVSRADRLGLKAPAYLEDNDSYHFFEQLGDLIITGPTGTNVNDIYGMLIAAG